MVCNLTVLEDEDGVMVAQLEGIPIAEGVSSRSKVLQDLLSSKGTATLPITVPAWTSWVDYTSDAILPLQSSLRVLQVAAFLGDDDGVCTLSRNIARVIRNSVRDLSWETAVCATQALSNLPGLAALPSLTAASRSHTSAIEVIAQLTSEACGPELCTVLEQMSLAEMLAFPEHLREAALNAHCPSGCFQLSAEEGPFTTAKIPAVQQYEGSLRLLQGFAPLLGRVGTRSLVLSSCGMGQEHVQVLVGAAAALASVSHLDISCNPLAAQDTVALITAVAGASSALCSLAMQSLSLCGVSVPLSEAFRAAASSLQHIDMQKCVMTDPDYRTVLLCMRDLEHLTYLDFSWMYGCAPDTASCISGLPFSSLKHLGLPVDCDIDDACAVLVDQLPTSTCLTCLVLTGGGTFGTPSPSHVDNARQVLQATASLPKLVTLSCMAMPIGSAVSESVSGGEIQAQSALTLPMRNLTIRNPSLYSPGYRTLFEMAVQGIPSHPWMHLGGLTSLCLDAPNNFEFPGAVAGFMQSLGCLSELRRLDLKNFRVVQSSSEALSRTLASLLSLTALCLTGSCVVPVTSMCAPPKPYEHPNTSISKLVRLEHLSLTGPQCHELPFGKVAWSLVELTRLTHLDLAYGTSGKGFMPMSERIAIAVGRLPRLMELKLDLYNTHGYVKYLTELTTLTALSLRVRCRLVVQDRRIVMHEAGGEEVVAHDEEALGRVMGRSALDAAAAKLLADLFCVLVGLQELCIDWAEVSDEDCVELQRGLKALTCLQRLEIRSVSQHGAQALFESLRDAPLMRGVRLHEAT